MNNRKQTWDNEYTNRAFISQLTPRKDVKEFFKWLRKKEDINISRQEILDIGCGTGVHSFFAAEYGANVTGVDISKQALLLAEKNKQKYKENLAINFKWADISQPLPFESSSMDICLDVMTSNSLTQEEFKSYIEEVCRVLKPQGYFFIRSLKHEGDTNAQNLLKNFSTEHTQMYKMPVTNIIERVDTKGFLTETLEKYFSIIKMEGITNYQKITSKTFKRNYWLIYLIKK